jgi:hypothetical protein
MNTHSAMQFFEAQQIQARLVERQLQEESDRLGRAQAALNKDQGTLKEKKTAEEQAFASLSRLRVEAKKQLDNDLPLLESAVSALLMLEKNCVDEYKEVMEKHVVKESEGWKDPNEVKYPEAAAFEEAEKEIQAQLVVLRELSQEVLANNRRFNDLMAQHAAATQRLEDAKLANEKKIEAIALEKKQLEQQAQAQTSLEKEIASIENNRDSFWNTRLAKERERLQKKISGAETSGKTKLAFKREGLFKKADEDQQTLMHALASIKQKFDESFNNLQKLVADVASEETKAKDIMLELKSSVDRDNEIIHLVQTKSKFADENCLK